MTKIECKYCGKKIDNNFKKCPKCHKVLISNKDKYIKIGIYLLWFLVQCLLCGLLYLFSKDLLYSEQVSDLYWLIIIGIVILINVMLVPCYMFKNMRRNCLSIFFGVVAVLFGVFALIYTGKITKAFIYNNSGELLMLSRNYELNIAKQIKNELEEIFEYDENGTFSRDILISNFYADGKMSNLYIEDSYGNYRLKFYVEIDGFKVDDVYSEFDTHKLYLVKDGEKTDNFEFYYAMNIMDNVLGEDVKGLTSLGGAVEEKVKSKFSVSANAIFNYEELDYHYTSNSFSLEGNVYNMDFYGEIEEKEFTISFTNDFDRKDKHVRYYGDSSFDYVNWDVKI